MRIAVAGGTGVVGRHVVEVARERGHEVVVLARAEGVDLVAGTGPGGGPLAPVLAGVDTVVDVTSVETVSAKESRAFFGAVTRHLLAAGTEAGVRHHVALSIVGVDRAPHSYYAGKVLQEQLVAAGSVPWTLLRATQFHEFAGQLPGRTRVGPLVVVPRMTSEPVAAREVAERLVALAEAGPAGRVADLGGPREEQVVAMVRAFVAASGARGRVVGLPLPGAYGRAMRDGTLATGPGADHGTQTYDEWLRGTYGG